MDIVLWSVWIITYLAGAILYEIYIMHMFQQNSYKPREYREWLRVTGNIGRLLGKTLYAFISLPLLIIGNYGCLIAACLMNLMTILVNKPHQAKKPLVYTPRVRRMLVTTTILFVIGILCSIVFEETEMKIKACAVILTSLFILIPFIVLLANLINHPVEK